MERTTASVSGEARRACRMTSSPPRRGRPMSRTRSRGRVEATRSTAAIPSPASPMIVNSPLASRIRRRPSRTTLWSSASATVIRPPGEEEEGLADTFPPPAPHAPQRQPGGEPRPAPGRRRDDEAAADVPHALAQAADPASLEPSEVLRVEAGAAVEDVDGQRARRLAHADDHVGRTGVAHDVGQSLLDDPERDERDGRRERAAPALVIEVDAESAAAAPPRDVVLDRGPQPALLEVERTQRVGQVAYRPDRLGDEAQGLGAALLVLGERRRARVVEQHARARQDPAEVVVELARDVRALLLAGRGGAARERADVRLLRALLPLHALEGQPAGGALGDEGED